MTKRRRTKKPNPKQDLALLGLGALFCLALWLRPTVSTDMVQPIIAGLVLILVGAVIWIIWYNLRQAKVRQMRALAVTGDLIDRMPGDEFERYIGEILKWQKYKITFTPASGDFGVDIVAAKGKDKVAVQIKRYKSRLDGAAIREAVAGKPYYGCNRAMVVTNSYFTKAAQELAHHNECQLVDRDLLADWIVAFQQGLRKHNQAG